jgi:hypothetical protein
VKSSLLDMKSLNRLPQGGISYKIMHVETLLKVLLDNDVTNFCVSEAQCVYNVQRG